MSSRGITQLKKLSLVYCDKSISNLQFRNYLCSQLFQQFEHSKQEILFNYYIKQHTNPHIIATYINGYIKEISLSKKTMENIHNDMIYIVSSFGRDDIKQMGRNVFSHRRSIQGQWTEDLWYKGPEQQLEIRKPIPQKIINTDQFMIPKQEKLKKKYNFEQKFLFQKSKRGSETTVKFATKQRPFKFTKQ